MVRSESARPLLSLHWTTATDNVGMDSYRVLAGGQPVGTVPGSDRAFSLRGLAPASETTFRIQAVDYAGNQSQDGPVVVFVLMDAAWTHVRMPGSSLAMGSHGVLQPYLLA